MIAAAGGRDARRCVLLGALLAALLAAPLFANDYLLTVLILILYFAYVGQAWNIMMGFAGQLSLGHALYVGLGAYTAAALLRAFRHRAVARHARPRYRSRWRAARVIGFLAFRFGVAGVYFAILTIAFAEFTRIGFDHFELHRRLGGLVPAGRAIRPQRSVEPARQADHVLLRDPGAGGRGASSLCQLLLAQPRSAISGWRSARTRRRRARSASTRSATR